MSFVFAAYISGVSPSLFEMSGSALSSPISFQGFHGFCSLWLRRRLFSFSFFFVIDIKRIPVLVQFLGTRYLSPACGPCKLGWIALLIPEALYHHHPCPSFRAALRPSICYVIITEVDLERLQRNLTSTCFFKLKQHYPFSTSHVCFKNSAGLDVFEFYSDPGDVIS